MVEHGAQVDHRQMFGYTPLLSAAVWGCTDVARYLADHGADVHARSSSGERARDLARGRITDNQHPIFTLLTTLRE